MTSREDIRRAVYDIQDEEFRDACMRLADALWPFAGNKDHMWTYKGLSKLLKVQPNDNLLHECVALLASRPHAKMLDMHFLYFDPDDAESAGERIDDGVVRDAYRNGYLVDPQDGREVREFESALVPYFVISDEAMGHGTNR